MDRYNAFDVSAPDYVPMAKYASADDDIEEDLVVLLAGLRGSYETTDSEEDSEQTE
jgi:hypothetical protein